MIPGALDLFDRPKIKLAELSNEMLALYNPVIKGVEGVIRESKANGSTSGIMALTV